MLFKEIIAVYSENNTKPIINFVGKIQSYWLLKQVVHTVTLGFKGLTKFHCHFKHHFPTTSFSVFLNLRYEKLVPWTDIKYWVYYTVISKLSI
jgi:hypothetical protein